MHVHIPINVTQLNIILDLQHNSYIVEDLWTNKYILNIKVHVVVAKVVVDVFRCRK